MSKEKVVLAYSGGLDTSVCVKWLQDEKNLDVVCVCGNVGQEETGLDTKKQKALDLGVLDCQVLDLRDEFSDEFLTKAIAANSMYENKYPLLSALSRCHLLRIFFKNVLRCSGQMPYCSMAA